jgi:hypothetical protein
MTYLLEFGLNVIYKIKMDVLYRNNFALFLRKAIGTFKQINYKECRLLGCYAEWLL